MGAGDVISAGRLVRRALRAVGVEEVYGESLPGCAVVPVSPRVAPLFAMAHERLWGRRAAVHRSDGVLLLGGPRGDGRPSGVEIAGGRGVEAGGPARGAGAERDRSAGGGEPVPDSGDVGRIGGMGRVGMAAAAGVAGETGAAGDEDPVRVLSVASVEDLGELGGVVAAGDLELRFELDLEAPVGDADVEGIVDRIAEQAGSAVEDWVEASDDGRRLLDTAEEPVVLAGPGVVRKGAVAGLQALAVAGSLGVLNTWGAKGVFHWRSRHHFATVGLQALDFELGGLAGADLIVATGVDPLEAPAGRWQLAPVLTVEPSALAPLAEAVRRPWRELDMPPVRQRLAAATQAGWAQAGSPIAPSRVTRNYAQAIGPGGLVAADPGLAGFWVARTYATTEPGSVHVPAEANAQGFAPACVAVAGLHRPGRPVLAVVDGPLPDPAAEVIEAARTLGVAVPIEIWHPDGDRLTPDDHQARVRRLVHQDAGRIASLAVDERQLATMIDAAGDIIAWPSLLGADTA